MKTAVVIPVGPGREDNLLQVLACLQEQTQKPDAVIVVEDGDALGGLVIDGLTIPGKHVKADKHEPGMEQPRNVGVRVIEEHYENIDNVWFLDSDVIVEPDCLENLCDAMDRGIEDRILVAPYDWMPPGVREPMLDLDNDPRWPMFRDSSPERIYRDDLSAGLACFSGNLVWPIEEFTRVGGFWSEIHHGRCEDGELGLRAVAMDVSISMASLARGWHLWHPVNTDLAVARNERDVPMLNARHPWVEGADVFMVDRDGKAFDVLCSKCQQKVPTIGWWAHAVECGVSPELRV